MAIASRAALVSGLRARFERDYFSRATMTVIVALAGLAAFGSSVACLRAGLVDMGLRYGIATLIGYASFLLLVRVWIALHRGWEPPFEPDIEVAIDGADFLRLHTDAGEPLHASLDVGDAGGDWFDFDLGEVFAIVLLALLVLGGVLALAWVVYAAPALLAEVALDAALVSSVSARLRREDTGSWAGAVVRRTAMPALLLTLFISAAGLLLQQLAPEAHSIGAALRAIAS